MTIVRSAGVAQERPSARSVTRARGAAPAFAAAALGIEQGAQVFEAVGGYQARGYQFPQGILHLTREAVCGLREIGEERGAACFEHGQHFPRGMRKRRWIELLVCPGIS